MRKIKNWKIFNESVEDSLEDIKWVLVDYDNIVPYDYYPNSTNLLVFRVTSFLSKDNLDRILRLANGEDWNVLNKKEFLIFYKVSKEEAILNWLNENYSDLKPKMQFSEKYYCNSEGFSLFSTTNFNANDWSTDVNAKPELWKVPSVCMEDDNLLDVVLKKWMKKNFNIDVRNIYYDED